MGKFVSLLIVALDQKGQICAHSDTATKGDTFTTGDPLSTLKQSGHFAPLPFS